MTNYNFSDMKKPAIFSAQTYGTKTSVEIDHSDLSVDEVMDAFQTLIVGMGYSLDSWKEWIMETAAEYQEEKAEKRMDIIGQNGNDGLHYGIDDEDEFELGGNG